MKFNLVMIDFLFQPLKVPKHVLTIIKSKTIYLNRVKNQTRLVVVDDTEETSL